jgi:hypothetical protein
VRSQHPIWFLVALLFLPTALLHGSDADLILHNGKIVTVDSGFSVKQAVAVRTGGLRPSAMIKPFWAPNADRAPRS